MRETSRLITMKRLKGQAALVTGANSGIGEAVAKALSVEGAHVVVNYVANEAEAQRVVQEIRKDNGTALALYADVSKEGDMKNMFNEMYECFGTIDILVNNAGMQRDAPFIEMKLEEWRSVIDVNLTGSFLCAREAAKEFIRKGVGSKGSLSSGKIVFISSVHEVIPWARHCNYAASKGA